MPRPSHLTRSDARALAALRRNDPDAVLDEIGELLTELDALEQSRGVHPDLSDLSEALEDDSLLDDAARLGDIRAGLRALVGKVERGEAVPTAPDERQQWNAEMARAIRELKEDMQGTEAGDQTDDQTTEENP
jgi:hypothetical protein